jgi:uncharacterized membrane protein YphA (DoxX/SURF4 family)
MAKGQTRSLSIGLLQWGLALFLIASGIWAIQGYSGFLAKVVAQFSGNEIAGAVYAILGRSDFSRILIILVGIVEIVGGVFIIIDFFAVAIKGTGLVLLIVTIVWIVVAVLYDIVGYEGSGLLKGAFKNADSTLRWFHNIGIHLAIIGGLLAIKKGKK